MDDQLNESATSEDDQLNESAMSMTIMGLLRQHVPLTLLSDLAQVGGPESAEIARVEGGDADWLRPS